VLETHFTFLCTRYAGGITLLVVYGEKITSDNNELPLLAEECVDLLANRIASGGGIWPVDIFRSRTPFIPHLKRKISEWLREQ